jgi:hypothetical protein
LNAFYQNYRPAETERRVALARLIRRICLLREQGDAAEARRLEETEFGNAVRDFRLAHGPASLTESELNEMRAREEHRIADAVLLAEVLIPQLLAARATPAAAAPDNNYRGEPMRVPAGSVVPFPPDIVSAPPQAATADQSAIPDMLDAMLAAERNSRRPTARQRH